MEKKCFKKEEKGITLVALVVTIIVLLILASVTLGMLTGENGIIKKAQEAKRKTEIAEWEERIDLAIIEVEQEKRNPILEDVIDKLYEKDIIDDKENDVNKETGAITTNEPEYVIEGKLDDYLDKQGGEEGIPPDLEGNVTFSYSPEKVTNGVVRVTITLNGGSEFRLQYSKYDATSWEEYTNPITMEKNGVIYARLINSKEEAGGYATGNVGNIDKLPPNVFNVTATGITENSITVTGSTTDATATSEYAKSGIKGYQFSKDNGGSWEPSTPQISESYTFSGLAEDTEYKIRMKAIDNAGNETITSNILIQKTESGGISAGDIAGGDGSIYGTEVKGYECESGGVDEWLIFYADSNNIYLIAGNYIPYENIPYSTDSSGTTTTRKPNIGSTARSAYFSNILTDYAGSSRITDEKIKALNNSYFNEKNYSSTNNNMRAVAYMLDTKAWGVYAGKDAEYAVGGPSIEMFFDSYNEKYKTNYVASATSRTGYKVGKGSASGYELTLSTTSDSTYVISSRNNGYAMWLASPCAINTNDVMYVFYDGGVESSKYDGVYYMGFRPLVCLKSDVKLEDNGDGSYSIK